MAARGLPEKRCKVGRGRASRGRSRENGHRGGDAWRSLQLRELCCGWDRQQRTAAGQVLPVLTRLSRCFLATITRDRFYFPVCITQT